MFRERQRELKGVTTSHFCVVSSHDVSFRFVSYLTTVSQLKNLLNIECYEGIVSRDEQRKTREEVIVVYLNLLSHLLSTALRTKLYANIILYLKEHTPSQNLLFKEKISPFSMLSYLQLRPGRLFKAVLNCIWKVLGSSLGRGTSYSKGSLPLFPLLPRRIVKEYFKVGHDCYL
jgi:hypothetical protein